MRRKWRGNDGVRGPVALTWPGLVSRRSPNDHGAEDTEDRLLPTRAQTSKKASARSGLSINGQPRRSKMEAGLAIISYGFFLRQRGS
jgi:hypothetical protein